MPSQGLLEAFMNGDHTANDRRFHRSSDKRVLGGVCGGLSDYFGFNLKATRNVRCERRPGRR